MYAALSAHHSFLSPGSPTYWPTDPNRVPDLLDFFVQRGLSNVHTSIASLDHLSSDHSPILLTLSLTPLPKPSPPSFIRGPINWELFRQTLSDSIDLLIPLKTPRELDEAVHSFTTSIQQSLWSSSTPRSAPTLPVPTSPPLPQRLQDLIQAKKRARTLWQRTRNPADRACWNSLCRQVKKELHSFRSESYNSYLESLSIEDKTLWRATKRILKFQPQSPPIRRSDGTWAASDADKADLFAQHLQ